MDRPSNPWHYGLWSFTWLENLNSNISYANTPGHKHRKTTCRKTIRARDCYQCCTIALVPCKQLMIEQLNLKQNFNCSQWTLFRKHKHACISKIKCLPPGHMGAWLNQLSESLPWDSPTYMYCNGIHVCASLSNWDNLLPALAPDTLVTPLLLYFSMLWSLPWKLAYIPNCSLGHLVHCHGDKTIEASDALMFTVLY
jgi:hypothetical protein